MSEMDLRSLDRQLKAGNNSSVYFIYGTEAYLKRTAAERLLSCLVEPEMADFNYQRFLGSETDMNEVADALEQLPLMAEHRVIMLEDMDICKAGADAIEILCSCIECVPEMNVFIIWQNDVETPAKDRRVDKIAKLCAKHGASLRLDIPRTGELAASLCEYAEEKGCRLNKNDAYYIIDRCGRDMTTLYAELDKLALYCGKKTVTREAVDLICPPSVEADVFQISKCILQGKNDDAFRTTERLLAQKVKPVEIFSQLGSNFIDLYRAKCFSGASMTGDDLIAAFPDDYNERRRFRVDNAMNDHSSYSLAAMRRYIELLYNAELALKSGRVDRQTCLEQLIARLCNVRNESRR